MVKQIGILILLFIAGFGGNAATKGEANIEAASPAVRNSLKYEYQQIAGKVVDESSNLCDDFNLPELRSHWTTKNESSTFSLKERPGFLRLKTQTNYNIEFTPGTTLSQKFDINTNSEAISFIDLTNLSEGDETGMFLSNNCLHYISVKMVDGIKILRIVSENTTTEGPSIEANGLMLRTSIESLKACFEYSIDGLNFNKIGTSYKLNIQTSNDNLVGIFYNNQISSKGSVDVDWFYYRNKKETKAQFAEVISDEITNEL